MTEATPAAAPEGIPVALADKSIVVLYPTEDPAVWLAQSRTDPAQKWELDGRVDPMTCGCPFRRKGADCAHLRALKLHAVEHPLPEVDPLKALTVHVDAMPSVHSGEAAEREIVAMLRDRQLMATFRLQLCPDAFDDEWDWFLSVAEARRLNPVTGQIHLVIRGSGTYRKAVIQTGIDGFRLISQRTGKDNGMGGPFWCGIDGEWRDVWTGPGYPVASKVLIYRKGAKHPYVGIAHFDEYVQTYVDKRGDGKTKVSPVWKSRPAGQIAKCAEALARRMAHPQDLSGIYVDDEMDQADNPRGGPAPVLDARNPRPAGRRRPEPDPGLIEGRELDDVDDGGPQDTRTGNEIRWYWYAAYRAAMDNAGLTDAAVANFLRTSVKALGPKIDEWLNAQPVTSVEGLLKSVGDWLADPKQPRGRYIIPPVVVDAAPNTPETAPERNEDTDATVMDPEHDPIDRGPY